MNKINILIAMLLLVSLTFADWTYTSIPSCFTSVTLDGKNFLVGGIDIGGAICGLVISLTGGGEVSVLVSCMNEAGAFLIMVASANFGGVVADIDL